AASPALCQQRGHGFASQPVNLDGPLQSLAVVGRETFGRLRVVGLQFSMQSRPPFYVGLGVDSCSYGWIGRRQIVQPFSERLVIQHGAPSQNRNTLARQNLVD